MNCEYHYCIYNRNFLCILENPDINSLGMCEACIVVSIPYDLLEKLKEEQIADLEKRWK